MSDKVIIFDTTLRDGEQCPGASMNLREKMEVARQLARLNVDVIEAGFPVISDGDFEAVSRIAAEVQGPIIAGLARCVAKDIDAAGAAVKVGARQVEGTVNGIGERAGNAALEEVVMAMKTRGDFFGSLHTGVNTKEIVKTSRLISRMSGLMVQRSKAIVGENAFAHSS